VSADGLHAEQRARVLIDSQLEASGWHVCDLAQLDSIHHPNSGLREVRMRKGSGQVDYLLYVDRKIVDVVEAKPIGTPLSGVEWQSSMYDDGLSPAQQLQSVAVDGRLPSVFEASGSEAHFTNGYDPHPRARKLLHALRPDGAVGGGGMTLLDQLPRLSTYDPGAAGDFKRVASISDPASRLFGASVPAAED
jgi:type I restriction enzyme R subunit